MAATFALAGVDDEGEIRRMLRENPLGGRWKISLEREPDGWGGPHLPGERQVFVLARDIKSGEVIGLCERLVRPGFVDGKRRLLPYLGALRIAPGHRHRAAILRGGFAMLRSHVERSDECRFAFTSIASDNIAAKRILEAGLDGMPVYRAVGTYLTLVMRARCFAPDPGIESMAGTEWREVATFLNREGSRHQFSRAWDEMAGAQPGLTFLVMRHAGQVIGVIGLWDQRGSRQTVLRGLPSTLRRLRHPVNLLGTLYRRPAIPAPGQSIDQAYLAALAVRGDDLKLAMRLVQAGLTSAAERGIRVATLGLPDGHLWCNEIARQLRPIEYRTDIYLVYWPGSEPAIDFRERYVFPEIALL